MFKIQVELAKNSYEIIYEEHIARVVNSLLEKYSKQKICWVIDENVHSYYASYITPQCNYSYILSSGEKYKTLGQVNKLLEYLLSSKFNRDDVLIVVGGGVTGDMAAFAASIYMRGIKFVQLPTTLLAMVDSSIGGKTGINNKFGKNLIGTFYQPEAVMLCPEFLKTLALREIRTGLAEVIKYGVIYSSELFSYLEDIFIQYPVSNFQSFPPLIWEKIIKICAQIKAEVVSKDERESSLRMILNYGHTLGHAVEQITHYKTYTHGEAIAIGMHLAAYIAYKTNICSLEVFDKQKELLLKVGLPVAYSKNVTIEKILQAIKLDKKVHDNKLVLILPEAIGKVRIEKSIQETQLRQILKML